MKKIILTLTLAIICLMLFSQKGLIKLNSTNSESFIIEILEQNSNELILKLNVNSLYLEEVTTPRGNSVIVKSHKAHNNFMKGCPDLPIISTSIKLPEQGGFKYSLISSEYTTIENIDIAPSKGTIYRNQNPEDIPYEYGREYLTDEFFPLNSIFISEPFILRDLRGSNVSFFPFSYNAIKKELRVYKEMIIKITFTNDDFPNQITSSKSKNSYEFNDIYQRNFINYTTSQKYAPIQEGQPGRILIISKDIYAPAMTPYINWKRQKGIEVELVLMSTIINNSTQLKTFIQNYYSNNNLTYVLLIGDAEDITPINISSGYNTNYTDNGYTYLAGNDKYSDIFIGRFSGNSIDDIAIQVEKTIHYERDLNTSDTWLENAFTSASSEGAGNGHNGGESDVAHMNIIKGKLNTYGYSVTQVNESGGNNTMVSNHFNAGSGIANYIGHGDVTMWVNTNFQNSNVNALTNAYKLPFIWSVACVNGDFKEKTCFAETWLRARINNQPTGAVAFLGSTINQSWQEPMTGQDEMIDILIESYSSNLKRTFGGLSFNGMFKMIEAGGSGQEMADTWTIFGDPSLMIRTKTPQEMEISHTSVCSISETNFQVNCNEENALVALSKLDENNEVSILGTAYVNNGVANVEFAPISEPCNVLITVTAFNKTTYQNEIMFIVPSGPYIVHTNYTINDELGNNNGLADYNETIFINETLKNVGVDQAYNVSANLSVENNNYANIIENQKNFGDINSDQVKTENNAFKIEIFDGIPDQTNLKTILTITDQNDNTWTSNVNILVNAPKMELYFSSIDDSEFGNNNGMLDAGETVTINVIVKNIGHASSINGNLNVSSNNEFVDFNNNNSNVNALSPNEEIIIGFVVTLDEDIPNGNIINFNFNLSAGMYFANLNSNFSVGIQIEDWESNTMTTYQWQNNSNYPWTIVTNEVYEGSYALKSGKPTNGGESSLIINLDVIAPDQIEFYKKVSCETEYWGVLYDYLAFSIDGVEKKRWGGEINWSKETYSTTIGQHEFKWSYIKDAYYNQGQDCAWLDNIKLPAYQNSVTLINTNSNILENSVEIYPNPAKDIAYLNINLKENSKLSMVITNITGQIVYEYSNPINVYLGHNSILINTNDFHNGIYIISVNINNEIFNSRLIINK